MTNFLALETPLGLAPADLVLERFQGEEAMSRPFSFIVSFWSSKEDIAATDLVGKGVTVKLTAPSQDTRYFHGIVWQLDAGDRATRGGRSYQLEIVPQLRLLAETSNSRIFQNMTALDIVSKILSDRKVAFQNSVKGSPRKREYCVQYRETDFNFVSRLLEEEGIFYFFQHADGKHTLMLADAPSAYQDCPLKELTYSRGDDQRLSEVYSWDHAYAFLPGKWAQSDYNFETPSSSLLCNTTTTAKVTGATSYEMYDYPGGYTLRADGTSLTKIRMEEEEALQDSARAGTRVASLFTGGKFKLKHPDLSSEAEKEWVIISIQHNAHDDSVMHGTAGTDYDNTLTAIPSSVVYRPRRVTPKPYIHGLQTAVVTGASGEEIYTDKYGRIKVQFPWDRDGKKDENSSCWIRVAHSIAGKQWGAIHLPRIGQEVVVSFLEGDPDRPLIVGSVYNGENMPPYTLPDNKTQSGFKSRSSLQGTASNFNELRFEDKKGSEEVYFHAEKDFNRVVENNDTLKVGSSQADDGSRTVEIYNNESLTVKTGDRKVTVEQGNELLDVKQGDRTVSVDMGNDTHQVKQGNRDVEISMGNDTLTIKMGNQTTKLDLGAASTEAMQSIELKVGQSSVKIDQTGVTIQGMMVKINGQVQTQVQGLMTQVSGSAMTQISGGITMIG